MDCYLCGEPCEGPEGVIYPVGGFGWRHLACDPQAMVMHLDPSTPADEAMYTTDAKTGDVSLSDYGQLVTARMAQDEKRQRDEGAEG